MPEGISQPALIMWGLPTVSYVLTIVSPIEAGVPLWTPLTGSMLPLGSTHAGWSFAILLLAQLHNPHVDVLPAVGLLTMGGDRVLAGAECRAAIRG